MLFIQPALRQRIGSLYSAMKKRAQPRLWHSGKRRGRLRVPGLAELPFTRRQLWEHVYAQVGDGAIRCPYCIEIGRPAAIITLENCVLDHFEPIERGGSWELANLRCCCEQCNREKGSFSYAFFVAIVSAIEQYPDLQDRATALKLLRSQGIVALERKRAQAQRFGERKTAEPTENTQLPLQEDF